MYLVIVCIHRNGFIIFLHVSVHINGKFLKEIIEQISIYQKIEKVSIIG